MIVCAISRSQPTNTPRWPSSRREARGVRWHSISWSQARSGQRPGSACFQRTSSFTSPPNTILTTGTQEEPTTSSDQGAAASPDVLDQLQKLGELRDAGVITPEEFETKKPDLLRRV